jgi:hypothetical protein
MWIRRGQRSLTLYECNSQAPFLSSRIAFIMISQFGFVAQGSTVVSNPVSVMLADLDLVEYKGQVVVFLIIISSFENLSISD